MSLPKNKKTEVLTRKIVIHKIMDEYVKLTMKLTGKNYSTSLNLMLLQTILTPLKDKNVIQMSQSFLKDKETLQKIAELDKIYIKNIKKLRRRIKRRRKFNR